MQENINKFMEIINSKNYDFINVSIDNMKFNSSLNLKDLDLKLDTDRLKIKSNSDFNLSIKLSEIKKQSYESRTHDIYDREFSSNSLKFKMDTSGWISLEVYRRI